MQHLLRRARALGKPWRLGLAAGVVVAVAAGAGVAIGAIPDSNGVIHGCYLKRIGTLRVIDTEAGQKCKRFETPLTWDQSGQQGPAGATGPAGAVGAAGPPGPAGVSGYQIVTQTYNLPASAVVPPLTTVDCPSGDKALSGGWDIPYVPIAGAGSYPYPTPIAVDWQDFPATDGSGWTFGFSGPAAYLYPQGISFSVYVVCAAAG